MNLLSTNKETYALVTDLFGMGHIGIQGKGVAGPAGHHAIFHRDGDFTIKHQDRSTEIMGMGVFRMVGCHFLDGRITITVLLQFFAKGRFIHFPAPLEI